MIFERREARAAGLRLVDLVVEGRTRFEFKSVGLRTLSRFNRNSYRQMLKDLIDEAGSDLLRLRRRRWVFDSRKLRGVSRDDIVRLFQKLLRNDRWFRGYPLREQLARAIGEMVVVWP